MCNMFNMFRCPKITPEIVIFLKGFDVNRRALVYITLLPSVDVYLCTVTYLVILQR